MSTIIDRCNEIAKEQKEQKEHSLNKAHNEYKDRCDVDKAWDDWFVNCNPPVVSERNAKSFAVFFAERVKGGKI